ncbi:YceI family protein [Maribacter sp. CXY002]|uniref:YceI family protein n=1 Tax=Maribacter luteocoastalis TaxID=3407671 RepID=UPI003B671241
MGNEKFKTYTVLILLFMGMVHHLHSQERYIDKSGTVVFEASEELFEPVKAKCETVTVIYDDSNKEIAALALIRGFQFKNPLMQEHFNENYVESDLYPKALFKGKVTGFDSNNELSSKQNAIISGFLEIRGVQKQISTNVTIQKVDNTISINGSFYVKPSDFDIKIPKIVENKIAKEVIVKLDFKLKRQ